MTQAVHDLLEQHFDTAFAAPDGIAKLRELILTLAMQGRLVEQDSNDPPASELLKKIDAEKLQLVKVGKIKKPKPLPTIEQADAPYELPKGWMWVRLGNIGNIFNGNSINAREKETKYAGANGLPYIATKDVGYGLDELNYKNGIYIPVSEEKFKIAHQGAVLICAEGGSAGKKCGITKQDICFGNKLFANELFGGIPSKFILYLYLSPLLRKSFNGAMTGIIGGVSIVKFLELLVPLPPLEEQNRIVARINQLMARCDELEKLRKDSQEKRLQVHAVAIKQLLDVPENMGWPFIQQHFGELYTVKENVAELRKAILQLAVMGRLVQQDPNDPPASELLKEIEAEKQRLIAEKKIKKQKSLPLIKSEEEPYELPQGWEWCYIQNVSIKVTDGEHSTPIRSTSGYYLLSARNVTNEGIKLDDVDYVEEDEFLRIRKRCDPEIGDVLLSCSGSVGRVAVCDSDEYVMVRSAALIKHSHKNLVSKFFAYTLRSKLLQDQIIAKTKTTAQSNLFLGRILELKIPLPPLPEQHRILSCIDHLMELCSALDAQIEAATCKQEALLNALMAQL